MATTSPPRPFRIWSPTGPRPGGCFRGLSGPREQPGGDAEILRLPDAGLFGNSHFSYSDLNNLEVADRLSLFLHQKGLDRRKP